MLHFYSGSESAKETCT